MQKTDLLIGFILGIIGALLGSFYLFLSLLNLTLQMESWFKIAKLSRKTNYLGAVINVVFFFGLLKYDKELMARGVVLATIALTILTLFV